MTYTTYKKAKLLLQRYGFETKTRYLKEADAIDLPLNPEEVYKDEWEGWEIYLSSLLSYAEPKELSDDAKMFNDLISRPFCN